ncbi:uncharacterized protein VP01_7353g1 [Puccinia sorghi]|uniref:HAT C-terminal dimerisation domain-containing protein n=1 Tax=Puccinia sorghi TaxID=27349 RepID=A0A0L6UEX2_9BASI|nr:uncharacterized protein VP01_7353g1 [Puccinia sorghi]
MFLEKHELWHSTPSAMNFPLVKHYLCQEPEPKGNQPLVFYAAHQKQYPLLSTMVHHFLEIPAASTSSKHVFSKGHQIVSWQQSSLKPKPLNPIEFSFFLCFLIMHTAHMTKKEEVEIGLIAIKA